jgi:hypothetical protein
MSPRPTVDEPTDEQLFEMYEDGEVPCTDGCMGVDPDSECEHGFPTWLVELSWI